MIKNISVKELKNIDNLIDIRSPEKYNSGHILNAINIPFNVLLIRYSDILNKNETYYIYCQRGIQSLKICDVLTKNGYDVINVTGGYEAWLLK